MKNPLPLLRSIAAVLAAASVVVSPLHTGASDAKPPVGLKLVAEGFVSPLTFVSLPDGRALIGDQVGKVHILNKDGKLSDQLFLDLTSKLVKLAAGFDERGLLGIEPHQKFRENRRLFIYYSAPRRETAPEKWDHTSRVSELKVSEDFSQADLASEKVLLEIDQPQSNHNGGRITFGPDGFLYIGMGDGGAANDNAMGHPDPGNGQNLQTLLGKILRIDVDSGSPYGIPKDNPYADGKVGRPEIYSSGWRNPWGLSFDTGGAREFFVADVGQNLFEEVNIVVKGGNYGWRVRESFHGFNPTNANKVQTNAPTKDAFGKPFADPILEYPHPPRNKPPSQTEPQGISVTGGYVYRGKAIPALQGKYVFADWSRSAAPADGVLLVATRPARNNGVRWPVEYLSLVEPARLGAYVISFGQAADGELYVMTNSRNGLHGTGKVFKLVPM